MSTPNSPLVILVHGAWHGAWCWARLQTELDQRGIASLAVDLPGHGASTQPLGDLYGDADLVANLIDRLEGPVILVGHSYGGAVITEAATRIADSSKVEHLVYLAAFVPDVGESVFGLASTLPPAEVALSAAMNIDGDSSTVDPALAPGVFYGDCDPAGIPASVARLCPQPMATFIQPILAAGWKDTPSTFVLCTHDQAVHPSHQAIMAAHCSTVVTFETDHSPFSSMPVETADVIAGVLDAITLGGAITDTAMKVRIGYGLGTGTTLNDSAFGTVIDALERLRFDSVWLSERIGGAAPDPLVAMSYAAGRTTRLKFGMSVMVLPGRNPVVLAKALATLDRLSNGRLLPAFGLGVANPHEQQAFGIARADRAKVFDEALAVVRSCWTDDTTTHHGTHFHYDDLRVLPKPQQHPLEVWLGGIAPSELKRVGRLSDGWLPSFITPADVEAARPVIERVAREHDREVPADHFGALIPYSHGPLPDALIAGLAARRPDIADPGELVPRGWNELLALIDRFVAVGTTKFVVLPIVEPVGTSAWIDELETAAQVLLPRQT